MNTSDAEARLEELRAEADAEVGASGLQPLLQRLGQGAEPGTGGQHGQGARAGGGTGHLCRRLDRTRACFVP